MKRVYMNDTVSIKKVQRFPQKYVKELVERIQVLGGTIESVALSHINICDERLLIIYEDNGHEEEIETFLNNCSCVSFDN